MYIWWMPLHSLIYHTLVNKHYILCRMYIYVLGSTRIMHCSWLERNATVNLKPFILWNATVILNSESGAFLFCKMLLSYYTLNLQLGWCMGDIHLDLELHCTNLSVELGPGVACVWLSNFYSSGVVCYFWVLNLDLELHECNLHFILL
jgi:hypothetical protein